ncbi:MAG: glycosyltransferase, partial [Thermaurantimonas sp.]
EGLPLVLLESMAYGNPFVATNVGAIEALAENNPDVIIVDNNEDAIKKGILLMIDRLRNNNIDRVRLQKYYSNNFGQDNIVKKWRETFNI